MIDFSDTLIEGQLSQPIYYGGSIAKDLDEDKIYLVNLVDFRNWLSTGSKAMSKNQVDYIRRFIDEKIKNGTLYTPDNMSKYSLLKRFQLFINSNAAEHAVSNVLNGNILSGNDEIALDSKAQIGDDGCALADVVVDGVSVEVKVTHDDKTKFIVLSKAHKQPIVAVYIISPIGTNHWELYIRGNKANYAKVDFAIGHGYYNEFNNEKYDKDLVNAAINWQELLRTECPKVQLYYFRELADGSATISIMDQK